jgi:hypothetical protein
VTDETREKLIAAIPPETFSASCSLCKIVLNDVEEFVRGRAIDLDEPEDLLALKVTIGDGCMSASEIVSLLVRFCHTEPRLPSTEGLAFDASEPAFALTADMTREEVVAHVESLRGANPTADLAFYAWRDLSRTPYAPFARAALERNPVSLAGAAALTEAEVLARVAGWPGESIYDGESRLAQPDEVWNFRRGDGFEKALLVANVLRGRGAGPLRLTCDGQEAALWDGARRVCAFPSGKLPSERAWEL